MFLQQAMNPWFAVHRASQVTMILLAVAMLVMPLLIQTEIYGQNQGGGCNPAQPIVEFIKGIVSLGGRLIDAITGPECDACGDDVKQEGDHYTTCSRGHGYYTCQSDQAREHTHLTCSACGEELSSANDHHTSCPEGHRYRWCSQAESDNHGDCGESSS